MRALESAASYSFLKFTLLFFGLIQTITVPTLQYCQRHRHHLQNQDSEQGTAIMVNCPPGCNGDTTVVEGTHWYSEFSSICRAAMHQGLIDGNGGFLQINLQRRDYLWILPTIRDNSTYIHGSAGANFVTSINMQNNTHRVFSIESFAQQMKVVHTIAGRPSAPLESGCGYHEAQPPTLASYNKPRGVATQRKTNSLDQQSFLVIADSGNNRIRAISAVCTIICENKGYCAGPDLCQCAPGWTGLDCTTPICSNVCGPNRLCVAPATCACKPGYGGSDCTTPQCQNSCFNGGQCSFPDTCSCAPGWFDTNCTTPVCRYVVLIYVHKSSSSSSSPSSSFFIFVFSSSSF